MIRRSVTEEGARAELGRSVTERVACVVAAAGCEAGRGRPRKRVAPQPFAAFGRDYARWALFDCSGNDI